MRLSVKFMYKVPSQDSPWLQHQMCSIKLQGQHTDRALFISGCKHERAANFPVVRMSGSVLKCAGTVILTLKEKVSSLSLGRNWEILFPPTVLLFLASRSCCLVYLQCSAMLAQLKMQFSPTAPWHLHRHTAPFLMYIWSVRVENPLMLICIKHFRNNGEILKYMTKKIIPSICILKMKPNETYCIIKY